MYLAKKETPFIPNRRWGHSMPMIPGHRTTANVLISGVMGERGQLIPDNRKLVLLNQWGMWYRNILGSQDGAILTPNRLFAPSERYPSWTRFLAAEPLRWDAPPSWFLVFLVPGIQQNRASRSLQHWLCVEPSWVCSCWMELLRPAGSTTAPCSIALLPPLPPPPPPKNKQKVRAEMWGEGKERQQQSKGSKWRNQARTQRLPISLPLFPFQVKDKNVWRNILVFLCFLLLCVLNLLSIFLLDSKPSRIKNQNWLSGAGHLLSHTLSCQADLQTYRLFTN